MKRIFCVILSLVTILCMIVACGEDKNKCAHSGGKANCQKSAICELCGESYGDKKSDNHTQGEGWLKTDTAHTKIYACCNKPIEAEAPHNWSMGHCLDCGYACAHTGGEANCTSGAACAVCGKVYDEKDISMHSGDIKWTVGKENHTGVCSGCFAVVVSEKKHDWENGACTSCGYTCVHSGGTATCQKKAVCEFCSSEYGELDPQNHAEDAEWTMDEKTHTKTYKCCQVVDVENESHSLEEGTCADCNHSHNHTGGEATCVNRPLCDICGSAYGAKNLNNHTGTKEYDPVTDVYTYTCCGQSSVG